MKGCGNAGVGEWTGKHGESDTVRERSMNAQLGTTIRLAAFRWLTEVTASRGDVLPRTLLQQGFEFRNECVPPAASRASSSPDSWSCRYQK